MTGKWFTRVFQNMAKTRPDPRSVAIGPTVVRLGFESLEPRFSPAAHRNLLYVTSSPRR